MFSKSGIQLAQARAQRVSLDLQPWTDTQKGEILNRFNKYLVQGLTYD